jgi:outer membrane protein assembly factor BamA
MLSLGTFKDLSGTNHSFTRVEVEGQERFPIAGVDRVLTVHGRLSSSGVASGHSVPFYLMDTLGGADNLRGFKEALIGGDEATSTLRSFESFRFRDNTTAFAQIDFRQRLWAQVFVSVFADAGMVASTIGDLSFRNMHGGIGVGVSVYRSNALAIRFELALWGGEGRPHYLTTGRGLQF